MNQSKRLQKLAEAQQAFDAGDLAGAVRLCQTLLRSQPADVRVLHTLAVIAYQMAADERLGEAALPSLTLVLVGVVPVIMLSRAIGRSTRPGG